MKFFNLLLAMLSLQSYAQLPVLTDDQFNQHDPTWAWSEVNDDNYLRTTKNGALYCEHRGPNIYWTLRPAGLNPRKDFRIEARFRAIDPMSKGMYHIIIRGSDDLYLYFGINTENKQYWLGTDHKGNWMTYRNGTHEHPTCEGIKTGLEYNTLAITSTGGIMRFSVNDVEINEVLSIKDKTPLLWKYIYNTGIATNSPMKTETDYFRIYQDNAINLATTRPITIEKEMLGPEINTPLTEKWPVVSPDGKTLYFTRNSDPSMKKFGASDDIFYSTIDEQGNWTNAVAMPAPINNGAHNSLMSITPDNNSMLLMHQYKPDGSFKGAGFSQSIRQKNGWSTPTDVPMTNFYNNKDAANEFCLSADRRVMVMSVNRNDTQGQNDLYFSMLQSDGTYSEPKNMGLALNAFGQEITPFIAADDKTLYFSSDSHPGYGSSDIFVSKRLDDTWTNWSKPQNLGPAVNTSGWEAYFSLPASGAYAYMIVGADIARLKLPKEFKPEPVVIVTGRVLDSKTKKPLEADITYAAFNENEIAGKALSSPVDGSYKIALPAGKQWGFRGEKDSYYAVSENLDLSKLTEYGEVTKDLYLTPIEKGQVVRMNNIFFDFNKSSLKDESFPELKRLIQLMNENKSIVIEITGHTDNIGEDDYNMKLSQSRSEAVMKYLQANGIASGRVTARGYGETKPLVSNDSDDGRAENRRVEFVIVKT